jgi:hypothetical protein
VNNHTTPADQPATDRTAEDEHAVRVLSISGAMCGVCGDEPGDRNCADCERVRRGYIADLRAAGWAPAATTPPATDCTALRDRIRRAVCEAEGFAWDPDMLEPDEYGEVADAVLAVLPTTGDRAAVLREAADAALLRTADLIAQRADDLWAPGSKAHTEMLAEAENLRRIAEDPSAARKWCKCPSCWGWFVEDHPGENLDELGKDLRWWSGLPEHRDAPAVGGAQQPNEARRPVAYGDGKGRVFCVACPRPDGTPVSLTVEDVDHWDLCPSCGRHVIDVARDIAQQQETPARPECAHCSREIENRGTPNMGGPAHDNWVHVPGGFQPCFPQRGADSPRAEPRQHPTCTPDLENKEPTT